MEGKDESLYTDILEKTQLAPVLLNLPERSETCISKEFDINGVAFSGGEMQRIAIARALYKQSPIIIFDEPTAALDPVTEYKIMQLLTKNAQKSEISLIVSHRMSSCLLCDQILLFDKGKVIAQGSHAQLLNNELYKSMWEAQAQYYKMI